MSRTESFAKGRLPLFPAVRYPAVLRACATSLSVFPRDASSNAIISPGYVLASGIGTPSSAGRYCCHLTAGRRYQSDEHNARFGAGENQGDRHTQGTECPGTGYMGQFLLEAAFLTFASGIIGVITGWGISLLLDRMGVMNTLVTPDIVILAVSVSVGIGLFFGFYPAWNASRLNPIEALRSE